MRWRLLHDPPAGGAYNMAVDEGLLLSAGESGAIPTVRFYRFDGPTLTFGYGQSLERVCRFEVCRRLGIDCIRRLTGGRALLHQHELTYSLASPTRGVFGSRSVREVYGLVSSSLARGLEQLGVSLDPPERGPTRPSPRPLLSRIPCLAFPERHEITSGGRKLVASAQRRRREAFLQHGSILRRVDPTLWERIRPEGESVALEAIGLDALLAPPPLEADLRAALESAFTELFGEPPSESALDERERAFAARLEPKYRSESWNHRRSSEAAPSPSPGEAPEC